MKKMKKLLSVVLCVMILFGSVGISSSAESAFISGAKDIGANILDNVLATLSVSLDRGLTLLLGGVLNVIPLSAKGIQDVSTYKNELAEKYSGHDKFVDEAADGAQFSLGYDKRSVMPEDFYDATYYKYGASGIGPLLDYGVEINKTPADLADYYADKFAEEYGCSQEERDAAAAALKERYAADILSVRTICLDDSRGKVLTAVVDCIGLTNASQNEILKLVDAYCKENGINDIVSVNVCATHTHSGIDTLGIMQCVGQLIDGSLISKAVKGEKNSVPDDKFMTFLYKTVADSMISAYNNMEKGDLYFAKSDSVKEYTNSNGEKVEFNFFQGSNDVVDFISEIYKLTFIPENASAKKTVITNFATHPEKVGVSSAEEITPMISADFIPYMEQQIKAAEDDCNFIFINSAIGSFIKMSFGSANECYRETYADGKNPVFDTTYENRSMRYGVVIGDFIAAIPQGEKVDPILNVKTKDITIKCDNPIIRLLALVRMTNNVILTDASNNVYTVTSVGYMEIGKDIKIFMCPGEMNPEVIHSADHMLTSEYSITKDKFQYEPLTAYFDESDTVMCFGLMNDMAGYIDPDNDYSLVVLRFNEYGQPEGEYAFNANFNAWLFSYSSDTASTLVGNFLDLVKVSNGEAPEGVITHDYGRVIPHFINFILDIIKNIFSVFGLNVKF
ncbi:MAG: hypothetical protein MJ120_04345 [Clostridia bacterium]|nr:hypothetical protein [Clostridia bacterium]